MQEEKYLIGRFKKEGGRGLREIYERYADEMLALAVSLAGDSALAEDVVQEVFVSLMKSAGRLTVNGSLKGYLVTCVVNRVRDEFRRRSRHGEVSLGDWEFELKDQAGPPGQLENKEKGRRLVAALLELPYEQREVVILYLQGEMKFRQIAQLQEVSEKTAMSRYRYGLDKLRAKLKEELE